ncbi:hypothetical protein HZ326_27477 [Fusarium oxysporum f. sp. albedinis]|nr:hypothetical protein HZ326_27477 [Fusarium oxysporum f. sp. albedinis]
MKEKVLFGKKFNKVEIEELTVHVESRGQIKKGLLPNSSRNQHLLPSPSVLVGFNVAGGCGARNVRCQSKPHWNVNAVGKVLVADYLRSDSGVAANQQRGPTGKEHGSPCHTHRLPLQSLYITLKVAPSSRSS